MATKEEKIFHKSAGYASEIGKAPTPFEMIGSGVKSVLKSASRTATKVATKLTGPIVREMKTREAKDKEHRRKGEAGELNY